MIVPDAVADFFCRMEKEPWFSGVSVNAFSVDGMGNNMIDYAITNGDAAVIKYLIEMGVDVNGVGEFGNTPLITAVSFEKYDLACYLLSVGADGNKRNNDGISAFDLLRIKILGDLAGQCGSRQPDGHKYPLSLPAHRSSGHAAAGHDPGRTNKLEGCQ